MGGLDPSETWSDEERRAHQWRALGSQLPWLYLSNPFYRRKWADAGLRDMRDVAVDKDGLRTLPFTTKAGLTADQSEHPPISQNPPRTLRASPPIYPRYPRKWADAGLPDRRYGAVDKDSRGTRPYKG